MLFPWHLLFDIPQKNSTPIRCAVLICFEDVFADLTHKFRKDGADFIVTITNEAWFKNSSEPQQHTAIGVFRAIENRCWFLRCANTGITCFISPRGYITNTVKKNGKNIFIEGIATRCVKDQ